MKSIRCIAGIGLCIKLLIVAPALAQGVDSGTVSQVVLVDSPAKTISAAAMFSGIAKQLAQQKQARNLSYTDNKNRCRITKEDSLFKVPNGESRAVLFELPDYQTDYIITLKSMVHGFGFTYHIFAPTLVFLDAAFKPVRFFGEKNFKMYQPPTFSSLHIKGEFTVDNERKDCKYMLVYTLAKTDQLGTYVDYNQGLLLSLLKHPVKRSPDGVLQVALHQR